MPATAEPKTRKPAHAQRVIEQAGQDRVSLLAACEQIMRDASFALDEVHPEQRDDVTRRRWRDLDLDERAPFELLHLDEADFRKGVARLHRVRRLQQVAGTSEDRTKAAEQAAASAKALEVQGPALRLKLLEVQGQLESLEGQAKTDAQRVESMAAAVQDLRNCVPEHIQAEAGRERNRVKSQFHEELTALESALAAKEGFVAVGSFSENVHVRDEVTGKVKSIPPADKITALHMVKDSHPELTYTDPNLGLQLNAEAFRAKQREYAAELPALREQVAKARQAKAEAMAEADKRILDVYAR